MDKILGDPSIIVPWAVFESVSSLCVVFPCSFPEFTVSLSQSALCVSRIRSSLLVKLHLEHEDGY